MTSRRPPSVKYLKTETGNPKPEAQVSILLPFYHKNFEHEIRESLFSICQQTLRSFEVVIIIDGPLPQKLRYCVTEALDNAYRNRSDIRWKIIWISVNRGLANALNDGLKHCSRDYVARFDADDHSVAHRLTQQLSSARHLNLDLMSCDVREKGNTSRREHTVRQCARSLEAARKMLWWKSPLNHPSTLFRKNLILLAGGFDASVPYHEDYLLWGRLLSKRDLRYKGSSQLLVAMHVDSATLARRGGLRYAYWACQARLILWREGHLKTWELLAGLTVSVLFRCLPSRLRQFITSNSLRSQLKQHMAKSSS